MPRFLDIRNLEKAIRYQAVPALERFAENPDYRRFERDEPPPYHSSESEDDEGHIPLGLRPKRNEDSEEEQKSKARAIIDPPLNEEEREYAIDLLGAHENAYSPGVRFRVEVLVEQDRILGAWKAKFSHDLDNERLKRFMHTVKGHEKVNIVARRNVRKRWEKLGVWNPRWGIPTDILWPDDHEQQTEFRDEDLTGKWRWKWETEDISPHQCEHTPEQRERHPVTRFMRSRQGRQCDEFKYPPPLSRLPDDATASEAESFIMSRPWFMFWVDVAESSVRWNRIPWHEWTPAMRSELKMPRSVWTDRGDWRKEWLNYRNKGGTGWKWRHESPSPEPEDLTALYEDDMGSLDFTPSEFDALEAVEPGPRSQPPPPPKPPSEMIDRDEGWDDNFFEELGRPNTRHERTQLKIELLQMRMEVDEDRLLPEPMCHHTRKGPRRSPRIENQRMRARAEAEVLAHEEAIARARAVEEEARVRAEAEAEAEAAAALRGQAKKRARANKGQAKKGQARSGQAPRRGPKAASTRGVVDKSSNRVTKASKTRSRRR